MESLKNFIGIQKSTEGTTYDQESQLDLMEKGLTCNYNPGIFM